MGYNSGTRWTEEEEKRLYHLYKRGWTVGSIARDLGRTANAIRARMRDTYGIELDDSGYEQSYRPSSSNYHSNNDSLFEQLRKWRYKESQRQDLPPYCVFHDTTLQEIADVRPTTKSELLSISGVGPAKLEEYGDDIIRIVKKARNY